MKTSIKQARTISIIIAIFSFTAIHCPADEGLVVIAETGIEAPGSSGVSEFSSTFVPRVSNGQIVFHGQDTTSASGFFTSTSGQLERIVDSNTIAPGTNQTFGGTFTLASSISNGRIAFLGGNSQASGVWVASEGSIAPVVRRLDPVPGSPNQVFVGFGDAHQSGNTTVFRGGFGFNRSGIFHSDGGAPLSVIDTTQGRLVPNTTVSFLGFTPTDFDGGTILFNGGNGPFQGVYQISLGGSISVVVDFNTPIPDGTGNFETFDARFSKMGGGGIVFFGRGSGNQLGIYLLHGGTLTTVVDANTLHPDLNTPFTNFNAPVVFGDRVFFIGGGTGFKSIFEFVDGQLSEFFREDDLIDGRPLVRIFDNEMDFDGDTLVFNGSFTGGFTSAILSADVSDNFVIGDINGDGVVNLLDVQPFIDLVSQGQFQAEADINDDGVVNLLDIEPFVDLLAG